MLRYISQNHCYLSSTWNVQKWQRALNCRGKKGTFTCLHSLSEAKNTNETILIVISKPFYTIKVFHPINLYNPMCFFFLFFLQFRYCVELPLDDQCKIWSKIIKNQCTGITGDLYIQYINPVKERFRVYNYHIFKHNCGSFKCCSHLKFIIWLNCPMSGKTPLVSLNIDYWGEKWWCQHAKCILGCDWSAWMNMLLF